MGNIEGSTLKPTLIANFMLVSFEQLLNEHFHWTMLTDTLIRGRRTNTVSRLSTSAKETGSLFYGRLVVTFGTRQTGLHTSLGICARGTWHWKKSKQNVNRMSSRCHGVCIISFTITVNKFSLLTLKLYLLKDYSSVTRVRVIDTLCFFEKNLFYKNVKAEINQNVKNVTRTFLRLRVD